jgi:hypothetical protein
LPWWDSAALKEGEQQEIKRPHEQDAMTIWESITNVSR